MAAASADAIGCNAEQMLVCSTGVIGRHLPMPVIENGIQAAARSLQASASALDKAAHGILTTDTRIKVSTRAVSLDGADMVLTGFAKGAAMIGPNMATMLAFVFSDAAVAHSDLATIARRAVDRSFNCISVESHTRTNDTVLLFANGSGTRLQGAGLARFEEAVSHFVTITVEGLRDDDEARKVAKVIAESALVKTAIFGADPNWGRFVSAAGYAGVPFEEKDLSLWLGDMLLYHTGTPQPFDAATASAYLKSNRNIDLRLRFTLGAGRCTFWTCDLGYEYVRLNAEYTT